MTLVAWQNTVVRYYNLYFIMCNNEFERFNGKITVIQRSDVNNILCV